MSKASCEALEEACRTFSQAIQLVEQAIGEDNRYGLLWAMHLRDDLKSMQLLAQAAAGDGWE